MPFDVIHIINRLYLLFEKVIKRFKGAIIETAGDGLYAAFGFDTSVIDAATNAYRAATNIFKELQNFNKDYLNPYFSHSINIGIGIHAGRVIMGSIVSAYCYSFIKCAPVAEKVRISLKGISDGQEVYLLGGPFY